jgi:hypothetical protein
LGTGFVALSILAPAALGQVTLLTQDRGLSHSIRWDALAPLPPGGGGSEGEVAWTTFGPFHIMQAPGHPSGEDAIVSARTELESALSGNSIQGKGSAAARLDILEDHVAARSRSSSHITVGFRVDGPTRYRLAASGSLAFGKDAVSESRVEVRLSGAKGPLYEAVVDSPDDAAILVERWGFLAPGEYEVHADAAPRIANSGEMLIDEEVGEFDVELQMGCPGDFNFDGAVTSQDFFEFMASFFGEQQGIDYTQDGAVDSADFFMFMSEFLGGC